MYVYTYVTTNNNNTYDTYIYVYIYIYIYIYTHVNIYIYICIYISKVGVGVPSLGGATRLTPRVYLTRPRSFYAVVVLSIASCNYLVADRWVCYFIVFAWLLLNLFLLDRKL